MDLSALDVTSVADAGAWLTLRHPSNNDDLPIRIRLAGRDSQIWRNGERAFSDRRLDEMQRKGKMGTIKTAQVEERGWKLLASVTLEWEGVELDGRSVPCTREQAEQLYRRFSWIAEQADEFVGDRANFLPAISDSPPIKERESVFSLEARLSSIAKN